MNRIRQTNRAVRVNLETSLIVSCVTVAILIALWCSRPAYASAPLVPVPGRPPLLPNGKIDKSQFKVTFQDNFSGTTLDTTKWENCDEPRQDASYWRPNMTTVRSGYLRLGVRRTNDPKYRYDCGAVRTQYKYDPNRTMFQQKYGYFETRCRLPRNLKADYWAAFWLMCGSVNDDTPDTRQGLEVDILESFNYLKNNKHHVTFHWNGYDRDDSTGKHNAVGIDSKINRIVRDGKFHTYGMYWDEKYYIFYVDDYEVSRTTFVGMTNGQPNRTPSNGPCQQPGHVLLSMEAAPWCGANDSAWESVMTSSDEFTVDYVKVYDL